MNRSLITLLLLIILGAAIAYAWIATPRQRRVAPGQTSVHQEPSQRLDVKALAFPAVADLDFSGGGDYPYQTPLKNLFGPLYLPPKKIKPRPVPRAPKVTKRVVKPRKIIPVVQAPGPKPIQPLKVIGHLNKAGDYTVFLSSKQGDVYLVKAGDVFANDLMIKEVNAREIVIARRQTGQQVVLPLGEVKSQRLPKLKFQSDRPEFKLPPEVNPDQPTPGTEPEVDSGKAEK